MAEGIESRLASITEVKTENSSGLILRDLARDTERLTRLPIVFERECTDAVKNGADAPQVASSVRVLIVRGQHPHPSTVSLGRNTATEGRRPAGGESRRRRAPVKSTSRYGIQARRRDERCLRHPRKEDE